MNKYILIALVVLVVLILAFVNTSVNKIFVQPILDDTENDFEVYWPQIETDIDRLEAENMFQPSRYFFDIGERINSSFNWKNGTGKVKEGSFLHLSKDTVDQIEQNGDGWAKLVPKDINENIDFSWLALLNDYDHWDLYKAIIDKTGQRIIYDHMPFPEISILLTWSKLAFIWSKENRTFIETSNRIRKLADILYSTNNLIACLAGVKILRIEHDFKSEMAKNGVSVPDSWKTFDNERTDSARAVFFAKAWAAHLLMSPDNIQRVFPNETIKTGDCLCINETALMSLMFKTNLKQKQKKQFEMFSDALVKYQNACNTMAVKKLWEEKTEKEIVSCEDIILEPASIFDYFMKYGGELPVFKETITKMFFLIYQRNPFVGYKNRQAEAREGITQNGGNT